VWRVQPKVGTFGTEFGTGTCTWNIGYKPLM
jgi:hypothetical protein